MTLWPFLNAVRKLATCAVAALLAWLAIANSPLWPHAAEGAPDNQHADHKGEPAKSEAHHEPNAIHHVMDSTDEWEILTFKHVAIKLPLGFNLFGIHFYISKFVILEIIAALLICAIYIPLANKVRNGGVTRGAGANFFEVLLTFVRDQVAKPSIGHDADRFVPFLWTMFLFILFNNLLGMVPLGGSPTASIFVTLGLALVVFGFMHGNGIAKMGPGKYFFSLWPHIDLPFPMGFLMGGFIFVLEWIGSIVRNMVLAIRLFANMFAGHMVLATLLIFIYMSRDAGPLLWGGITLSSVLGIVALSLLELFVAFLQAFVFTFLTALFLGMALHPEH
ncbi:MAG TPA: F0F1 ATP synthase subunit A [Gemmataceae bacterium]|nr:F0F1 ATP synthase subunit A [Gemmataceae bacterium]